MWETPIVIEDGLAMSQSQLLLPGASRPLRWPGRCQLPRRGQHSPPHGFLRFLEAVDMPALRPVGPAGPEPDDRTGAAHGCVDPADLSAILADDPIIRGAASSDHGSSARPHDREHCRNAASWGTALRNSPANFRLENQLEACQPSNVMSSGGFFMRIFALAAAAILTAGPVAAATYSYQGNPIPCWSDCGSHGGIVTLAGTVSTTRAIKGGSFTAETTALDWPDSFAMKLTIEDASGITEWTGTDWLASGFITGVTGSFGDTFAPVAYAGTLHLEFDSKGRVSSWFANGINGGSWDWGSNWIGDANGHGENTDPGRWIAGEVPLPASLPLLAGGLLALGYRRRPVRRPPFSAGIKEADDL